MDPIETERLRASAARVDAWVLWALSLVFMGATFACINTDNPLGFGFAAVMLLLATAAASQRVEQRQAQRRVAWLEGAWMDEWAGAWQ